jgi:hypothetical protein
MIVSQYNSNYNINNNNNNNADRRSEKLDLLEEENLVSFYLDSEPCGPRTELWSGYLEENGEISFVANYHLWIRCSAKQHYSQRQNIPGEGIFFVIVHQSHGRAAKHWATYDPVQHNFGADFSFSPTDVREVAYFIELAALNGEVFAKTPILRPYTERWFREKVKKQNEITPLRNHFLGRYAAKPLSDQEKIVILSQKVQILRSHIAQLEQQIAHQIEQNRNWKEENVRLERQIKQNAEMMPWASLAPSTATDTVVHPPVDPSSSSGLDDGKRESTDTNN